MKTKPPRSANAARTHYLPKLTPEEGRIVAIAAEKAGLSVAAFVRRRLGLPPPAPRGRPPLPESS